MTQIQVPGIVYSLILAVAAWATTYFATGQPGGDYIWAPILLAAIPTVLKFLVEAQPTPPAAQSRGTYVSPTAERTYLQRVMMG